MPKITRSDDIRMTFIGVDPGQSGGICILLYHKLTEEVYVKAYKMPDTERDIWDLLNEYSHVPSRTFGAIELVHAMPGQGVTSMFTFGKGYGGLRMALVGNRIPFEEVTPSKWQAALGIKPCASNESKTHFKNRLKARAQQLYPHVSITLSTCDAILIAEYSFRKYNGQLGVDKGS